MAKADREILTILVQVRDEIIASNLPFDAQLREAIESAIDRLIRRHP